MTLIQLLDQIEAFLLCLLALVLLALTGRKGLWSSFLLASILAVVMSLEAN